MRNAIVRQIVFPSLGILAACGAASPPNVVADSATTHMSTDASEAAPAPKPAGKISPEMAGNISPIPAMMASGDDWTFEMRGTQGMEHRATLLFQGGAKRFEGIVTYRDTSERAGVRSMRFDGALSNEKGRAEFTMSVAKEACTSRDGRQSAHTLRFVLGRAEYLGCAEVAMY